MTDFFWATPTKKPQNTLHLLKSKSIKNNPYIIKMCPDSPHKQNLPMPLPIQRRIYQRRVNKGICGQRSAPEPKQGEKIFEQTKEIKPCMDIEIDC